MNKGLIEYTEICELSLRMAIEVIVNNPDRLRIGNILLEDLSLVSDINKLKFTEYDRHEVFGWGAYIVFNDINPIYIGAAEKHFLHRFQSHLHIDNRGNWGWNTLLFKLTQKDVISNDDLSEAKCRLLLHDVVRVCLPNSSRDSMCLALERELMIGFKYLFPHSILNERVRKVKSEYLEQHVDELVNTRSNRIEYQRAKRIK